MNKKLLLGLLALAAAHSAAQAQSRRPHLPAGKDFGLPVAVPRTTAVDNALAGRPAPTGQPVVRRVQASFGQQIGQTTYDLQSNRSTPNRVALTGTALSAVWTQSCALSGPSFTPRGVGYNFAADASVAVPGTSFVNGTVGNCPSVNGLMTLRTGWPEVVHVNGNEVVFAHSGTSTVMTSRSVGNGSWSAPSMILPFSQNIDGPTPVANGTWPRAVASGNTIHLIYTSSISQNTTVAQNPIMQPGNVTQPAGIVGPVVYSRSLDGGVTWDKTNMVPPGMDRLTIGNGSGTDTVSIGGDSYAIATNGQNVAITAGSTGDNTIVATSSDNGTTWSHVRIHGPFTDADTVGVLSGGVRVATVLASDGSMALVIDNTGTTHWLSGAQLWAVKKQANGNWVPSGSFFPDAVPALLYWNNRELRNMKPQIIAELDTICPTTAVFTPCNVLSVPDGTIQTRQPYNVIGPVSMPTASIDANGDVYVIYASGRVGTSNTGDNTGQYFRDLYLQQLTFPGNGQVQVHQQKNISRDLKGVPDGAAAGAVEESVFPSAVHTVVDNKIHYQFMSDGEPGNALQPTAGPDPEVMNQIIYDQIQLPVPFVTNFIIQGVVGLQEASAAYVTNLTASPNPTTGVTTLNLSLRQDARATIVVRNVLGQEVLRVPATAYKAGASNVRLDLSGQGAGVYFYTVAADNFSITKRVVKQ